MEPIARAANREDICKGRFWEGRFKCQALLDDNAVLAAMAYVDLNLVRAKLCDSLDASHHTSAKRRFVAIEKTPEVAAQPLAPIAGIRGWCVLRMTQGEYLAPVDYTGRQVRPDKRGAIAGLPPAILGRLDCRPEQWARQVMAVGSSFNRAVGQVESLIEKTQSMIRNGIALPSALARIENQIASVQAQQIEATSNHQNALSYLRFVTGVTGVPDKISLPELPDLSSLIPGQR